VTAAAGPSCGPIRRTAAAAAAVAAVAAAAAAAAAARVSQLVAARLTAQL